jgi:hypothetical protein
MIDLRKLALTGLAAGTIAAGLFGAGPSAEARVRPHAHRVVVTRRIVLLPPRPLAFAVVVGGVPGGAIDFNVEPEDTKVRVDGRYVGTVDQYDGFPGTLHLLPGDHLVKLTSPDGESWTSNVFVPQGQEVELNLELEA